MRDIGLVAIAVLGALLIAQGVAMSQSLTWPYGESAVGGRMQASQENSYAVLGPGVLVLSTKTVAHVVLSPLRPRGTVPRAPSTHW